MLNLNSIMIGTDDSKKLAGFYERVLEKKPDMADGDWYGFSTGSSFLSIGLHDKVHGKATNPERLIFNFETKEVEKEFDRIKAIEGVTVIKEPYHPMEDESAMIATFADPDGNYFQLNTPWSD